MREIKYRAWDKSDDSMKDWNFLVEYSDLRELFEDNLWMPMQYTGLKDKNGKEIYEGDICKQWNGTILVCQWSGFGFFEWWDYFAWEKGYYDAYLETKDVTPLNKETTLEVIGNIYENPELLKQEAPDERR